jgi:transposase
MRGRYPLNLQEALHNLEGSEQAKARMKVIVATLTGQCRLQQACAQLGLSEARVQQLRQQFLEGGLASLEPGQAGRPARLLTDAERQVQELTAQLAELQVQYQAAQLRAEVGAVLPQVLQEPADAQKKTAAPGKKRRGRPPGRRTST